MPNKKHILIFFNIIIIVIFFSLFVSKVYAITLDKNSYVSGEPITFIDEGGPYIIFDLINNGNPVGGEYSYSSGGEISNSTPFSRGDYSVVEFTSLDIPCFLESLSYDECKQTSEFVGEFLFTITPASSGDGGADFDAPPLDPELDPANQKGSIISYTPEVNIFSIPKGSYFSDKLNIDYKATDQNDNGNLTEKSGYGLGQNPISLFYSDKVSDLYGVLTPSNKIEIAKNQPVTGKYEWSVKNLIPGTLYRIIVDAVDSMGLLGEGISELFGVDITSPIFTVNTNPTAIRNGEVVISVDSSEDLSKIPEVTVTQNGGSSQTIIMNGEKSHYEGAYKVVAGFDGKAIIKVTGVDIALNIGNDIVSGGSFSVGMNPPPKPNIYNYKEKIVTNNELIDITGNTRSDTLVALSQNGKEISRIKPETNGDFAFNQIKLDKTKNNGLNYIEIFAIDPLGASSESVLTLVKYNIPPTIKITNPKDNETLSNIYNINVDASDENNDNIFYTYQILSLSKFKNKIYDWVTISENNPSKTFSWNTAEVDDGDYMIQVIADDKEAKTISNTVMATIKNVLPRFIFEDGRNTITRESNVIIKGKVLTSSNLSPRPDIVSVAYSLDNGLTWAPVKIINDGGDYQKKFSVSFSLLKEGTYPVLWRTKDTRGFIGLIVHPIIIDKTAPKSPVIVSPRIEKGKDVVINDSNDEDSTKDGIQISINGKTEAFDNVSLDYNGKIITTKALATGEFIFKDITFNKKGKYDLSIFVTDVAGNKSGLTNFFVLYNNPPIISFINPKPFRGVSGIANISWSIKDPDNDQISNVIVSYRNKDKNTAFTTLISNASAIGNYNWNTNKLSESNNYELKISASDQYSAVSSLESFSIDRTAPILTSFIFSKNQTDIKDKQISFICTGEGTDNLSGVEFVEYAMEDKDGKLSPWYKGLITSGYLKNKATYEVKHPVVVLDGEYKVLARIVDSSGNISESKSLSLSVDKTAPRIGGFFLKAGNVSLNPDETGNILVSNNNPFTFNISLEEDTKSASIKIGDKDFDLEKDIKTQLWQVNVPVSKESTEKLFITALDISSNIVENKEIGSITYSETTAVSKNNTPKISRFMMFINKIINFFK